MSPCRAICLLASAIGCLLALGVASPLSAQTLTNTFGGLSESSDQPIDIESDVLVVYDAKKYATFKGNVKAVQGTTTLRAAELDVHYVGGRTDLTGQKEGAVPVAGQTAAAGAKAGGGTQTQISKIEARGDVVITSEDDQTTTSDWAVYDVPAQVVTVGGNVVLTQGQNVLKGDRLIIDLKTGESRFENTGNTTAGGRIRALFMPKQGAATATPGTAVPADTEPQSITPAPAGETGEPVPAPAVASDAPESEPPPPPGPATDAPTVRPEADAAPSALVPEFR